MRRNVIETVMGAVVLIVAGLFIYIAYTTAQIRATPGYLVSASFLKLGGLAIGSDVKISGITVGSVVDRRLDPNTYDATIVMSIASDVKVPDDTVASIASEGPLGDKYVRLQPGNSKTYIEPGGTIRETKSYKSLEDQVGEIIFLATSKPGEAPGESTGETK